MGEDQGRESKEGEVSNRGSAESTVGEQDAVINSRETRELRRGATCDR